MTREEEQKLRDKIAEELHRLGSNSDTYVGHNAYIPAFQAIKVVKGNNG